MFSQALTRRRVHAKLWRADLLFAFSVVALLSLHMAEIFLWSAALIAGDIVDGWAKASFFAANCYTALGEPFALPHAWRLLPPIIAISGIFTFAWTASVLVNFVARYNELRRSCLSEGAKAGRACAPGAIAGRARRWQFVRQSCSSRIEASAASVFHQLKMFEV